MTDAGVALIRPAGHGVAMLLTLAAVFAVVNGANDGGAMLASTLKGPGPRVLTAIGVFAVALVAVPLLVGTGVAETLTSGLVAAPTGARAGLVATGVVAAVAVVAVLTATGLPTSLTLGVVGGIVGAGVGRDLPVETGGVARVVLIGLAAPVVGSVLALLLGRLSPVVPARWGVAGLERLHWSTTIAQSVAYAANDGQKMLAVVTVTSVAVTAPVLLVVATLFAVGTVLGIGAAAGTLGGQIVRAHPREQVTAQLAGSVAVLSSAALGVPVSMTQAVSGGLVGTGMLRGVRQVRWRSAAQLALAWIVTLPSAALVGYAGALVVRVVP